MSRPPFVLQRCHCLQKALTPWFRIFHLGRSSRSRKTSDSCQILSRRWRGTRGLCCKRNDGLWSRAFSQLQVCFIWNTLQLCNLMLCGLWKSESFTRRLVAVVTCLASWWECKPARNELVGWTTLRNILSTARWWEKEEREEGNLAKLKA